MLAQAHVPAEVKAGLVKMHAGVNASWEKEDGNYEANFKEAGKTVSVVINRQGTIVETETGITTAELPAAARNVSQNFHGKKIQEVAKL